MVNPTLGYEQNTTLSKISIAQIQLVEAINLFIANKFLCAITLAGAAEEIFGKLLMQKFELPVICHSIQKIQGIHKEVHFDLMHEKSEKQIIDEWNLTRNSLKHIGATDEAYITINFCDEAYWMIKRALDNAQRLKVPILNELDFKNWVILNINL